MQGNATEIDERNLLQLDALLSHGYGLSPQLVMRSKGLSIEAKALYGYLSSFAGAGDTAFPSTSRILEELDISKNRFYKIRKPDCQFLNRHGADRTVRKLDCITGCINCLAHIRVPFSRPLNVPTVYHSTVVQLTRMRGILNKKGQPKLAIL